jgi:hypothetical protein
MSTTKTILLRIFARTELHLKRNVVVNVIQPPITRIDGTLMFFYRMDDSSGLDIAFVIQDGTTGWGILQGETLHLFYRIG